MVTFVIVRHGHSIFNKEHRFSGQMDIPLNETGVRQAELTAAYILEHFHIDKIYASDLCRAVDTAKPVAQVLGLPIIQEKDLREVYAGCWEGKTNEELKREYPESFAMWKNEVGLARCGDGEHSREVSVRCNRVFRKIAAESEGKTVLVSTHGGLIRALRCNWSHTPLEKMKEIPHVTNASITVAEYDNETGEAKFLQVGFDGHLADMVTEFVIE